MGAEPELSSSFLGPDYDAPLKRHTYSATIGQAGRGEDKALLCPTHAYSGLGQVSTFRSSQSAPVSLNASRNTSRHASRPTSPLGQRAAASAPGSRSSSRLSSRRSSASSKRSTLPPLAPIDDGSTTGDGVFPHSFAATIGGASTGRGELPSSLCQVHAYGASDASLSKTRASPSATFGTAPTGRGSSSRATNRMLPALEGPPLIGTEAYIAQQPHTFHSTFGRAPRLPEPRAEAAAPHAYLSHDNSQPFRHSYSATFGTSLPRTSLPATSARRRSPLTPIDSAVSSAGPLVSAGA